MIWISSIFTGTYISSIKIQTFKKQSHNLCGYPVLKTPQERGNAEDETENTR